MKNILIILALLFSVNLKAQTYGTAGISWGLNGNRILDRNYIGTNNFAPLNFKTAGILTGYFDTDQSLYLQNVPTISSNDSVLTISNGQIRKKLNTSGGGGSSDTIKLRNGLNQKFSGFGELGGDLIRNTHIIGHRFNFELSNTDTTTLSSNKTFMVSRNIYMSANTQLPNDSAMRTAVEINGLASGFGDCSPNIESAIGVKLEGISSCHIGSVVSGFSSASSYSLEKNRIGLLLEGIHSGGIGYKGTGIGIELKGDRKYATGTGTDILISPKNGYLKINDLISSTVVSLYGKNIEGYMVNVSPQSAIPNPTGGAVVDVEARATLVSILTALRNVGIVAP